MALDSRLIPNFLKSQDLGEVIVDSLAPVTDLIQLITGELSTPINSTRIYVGQGYQLDNVAVYVSPMVDGTPTGGSAVRVRDFDIPYIKHKDTLDVTRLYGMQELKLLERDKDGNPTIRVEKSYLEKGAELTPELLNFATGLKLQDHRASFALRKTIMAAQFLLNGAIDCRAGVVEFIDGAGATLDNGSHGNYERLDFFRDASLKASVASTKYFDYVDGSGVPSDIFATLSELGDRFTPFGYTLAKLLMSNKMFLKMTSNGTWRQVQRDKLTNLINVTNPKLPFFINDANNYRSHILEDINGNRIEVIVWQKLIKTKYLKDVTTGVVTGYDPNGIHALLPDDMVVFIGADVNGNIPIYHGYGRILDMKAQLNRVGPLPIYSTVTEERKAYIIESESAPIVYGDPNCCFAVKLSS